MSLKRYKKIGFQLFQVSIFFFCFDTHVLDPMIRHKTSQINQRQDAEGTYVAYIALTA